MIVVSYQRVDFLFVNFPIVHGKTSYMPPFYAHIRKDGNNFALIDCYSTGDDFSVEPMHPIFKEPEWIVHFLKSDINSIPLQKLLELLPI